MSKFVPVTADFAVAPQIAVSDVQAAAVAGFRRIINNRPDYEQPGQPTDAALAEAAAAAGLAWRFAPIVAPTIDAVDAMAAALAEPGPMLAFCRSGTRSITLWALAQAKRKAMTADDILTAARGAGYDLGHLRGALRELAEG
jgi:sulfide:quinone oxidoreductase